LHGQAVGAVGAGVADDGHLLGHQFAIVIDAGFVGDGLRVAGAARHKFFGAGQLQPHRATGGNGQVAHNVIDQHFLFGPKAPADARFDHPDALDRQP
jgi:hypothetical protein